MGRPARGVRGIKLGKDDEVISLLCVDQTDLILSMAELGIGKRTQLEEYRVTARGGKGVINMKITKRTGAVVAVMALAEDEDLVIVTKGGKIIRIDAAKIRKTGRSASGVKLVDLDDDDSIAAASVAPQAPDDEGGDDAQGVLIQ